MLQRSAANATPVNEVPAIVYEVLRSPGQPLDARTRAFMEPRFGHDFSRIRTKSVIPQIAHTTLTVGPVNDRFEQEADWVAETVMRTSRSALHESAPHTTCDFSGARAYTNEQAADSARSVNSTAYTIGRDVVFDAGQHEPRVSTGQKLIAHGVYSTASPRLQRFTAELGEDNHVFLLPEKGDNDADLDKTLCPSIKDRKIAGRKRIDVTSCLPAGTIKAMALGPYNCADFVRTALQGKRTFDPNDYNYLLTTALWYEQLKAGYKVASFAEVTKEGTVLEATTRKKLTWKQLSPRIGDIVFMIGMPKLKKSDDTFNQSGDNFIVNWDHVGFFIVRSRSGFDYHLAKDGDENPIGVYHTGMTLNLEEGLTPGAYVKGVQTIGAYLRAPEKKEEMKTNLQRRTTDASLIDTVPPIVHEVLRSPGQPLDAQTRTFMEPRFGHDFSHVRVHSDAKAADSARAVNALAYTVGQDVVFGDRQYAPETYEGKRLLAHELTHVVQQTMPNIAQRQHIINLPQMSKFLVTEGAFCRRKSKQATKQEERERIKKEEQRIKEEERQELSVSEASVVEETRVTVGAIWKLTNPEEFWQTLNLNRGVTKQLAEYLKDILEKIDTLQFDEELDREQKILEQQRELKEIALKGEKSKKNKSTLKADINKIKIRIDQINTLKNNFAEVKAWFKATIASTKAEKAAYKSQGLKPERFVLEAEEKIAAGSAKQLCNVISYYLYGQAIGKISNEKSFGDFYIDSIQKGQIGLVKEKITKDNVRKGVEGASLGAGSAALREQWGMHTILGKQKKPISESDWRAFDQSDVKLAISFQSTGNNKSPNHFFLIIKDAKGVWRNMDHTSQDFERRGGKTDPKKVYGLYFDESALREARKLLENLTRDKYHGAELI